MKRAIVFLICVSIASPLFAAENSELIDEAIKAVNNVLKDEDSAKFRNVVVHKATAGPHVGKDAVCGEMNAKNSFGGYTGFTAFVYADGKLITPTTLPELFDVVFKNVCES